MARSLKLTSFQAYKLRVTHLYQLKQHSILVSVGQDEPGINPLVKALATLLICKSCTGENNKIKRCAEFTWEWCMVSDSLLVDFFFSINFFGFPGQGLEYGQERQWESSLHTYLSRNSRKQAHGGFLPQRAREPQLYGYW